MTLEPWEQRSKLEKYGGMYYLAVAGLILLLGMVLWFAWGIWSLREVWRDVYVLHDASRSEADRIRAADRLVRNPDATPQMLYELSMQGEQPELARYLITEALTPEAISRDPRSAAVAVATREGWPDWFRLLQLRLIAHAAGAGEAIDPRAIRTLKEHPDPVIRIWAWYTLAESSRYNQPEADELRRAACDGPHRDLATLLVRALDAKENNRRVLLLDEATEWIRENHPGAVGVWSGWSERDGRIVAETARSPSTISGSR